MEIFSEIVVGHFVSARKNITDHPNNSVFFLTMLHFLSSQGPGLGLVNGAKWQQIAIGFG